MVEGSGLENRRAFTRPVGSNPTLSASFPNVRPASLRSSITTTEARGPAMGFIGLLGRSVLERVFDVAGAGAGDDAFLPLVSVSASASASAVVSAP